MRAGIIGFPQVGKTTLFQILTEGGASSQKGRAEAHIGTALVRDDRLTRLSSMFQPKKTTPATVEYVDVAGMSRGNVKDNKTLAHLKTADTLVHVIRAFDDPAIAHEEGSVDPRRDFQNLEVEFLLSDLAIVENRLERLEKDLKRSRDRELQSEQELMTAFKKTLESEQPLRTLQLPPDQLRQARSFAFLSLKPQLVVLNLDESQIDQLDSAAERYGLASSAALTAFTAVCGKIEAEIAQLSPDEAEVFLKDLGFQEPGLNRVIRKTYELLGLISFFTVGEDECRAWTVAQGINAQKAAGTIHSDIERGFIRAEVCRSDDLLQHGSMAALKSLGLFRLEGKDYVVRDGDVIHYRFNI